MKAGPREKTVWLENKLKLENMNVALTHLFFGSKEINLQRASAPSQMCSHWVTNITWFQQLEIPISNLSPFVGTLKNHTCPTWKNRFAGHCISKACLKVAFQTQIPSSTWLRHHHQYHHLVCSDLTGTLRESGWDQVSNYSQISTESSADSEQNLFWKLEPCKEMFPSQMLESVSSVKPNHLFISTPGE